MPHRLTSAFLPVHVLLSAAMLLAPVAFAAAQDDLIRMRAQYAAETNPVGKAKILAKLGPREMTAMRAASQDDEEKALAILQRYRDAVRETTQALLALGVDAARHPGGFKELQISLRMFIRRLDDLILSLQQDQRASFRAVRADLETDESSLIDALFPARPPRRPSDAGRQRGGYAAPN